MAVIAEVVGVLFLFAALYYTYAYTTDVDNPLKHEYGFGIGLGLLYGFSSLLVAAFLAISVKGVISRKLFLWLSVPAIFSGVLLLGFYLFSVGADAFAK